MLTLLGTNRPVVCVCVVLCLVLLLQDPSAIQAAHSSAPVAEVFNAMSFLSSKGKGKPVAGQGTHTQARGRGRGRRG